MLLRFALLVACAPSGGDTAAPAETALPDVPGHNDCLAEGEEMTEEVCLQVVEVDGRYPTVSEDKSGAYGAEAEARAADPDLEWLRSEAKRCTCSCCHTRSWGGPGVYFWDLEWSPVWIDSASGWSLRVLAGETEEEAQTLPSTDPERVKAYVERVLQWRDDL